MKLTLDIIREALPETCQCRKVGPEGMHLSFGRPILLEPGDKLCPGHLYVGSSSTLQKVAPHRDAAVICAGRQLPAGWADSGGPMLLVTAGPDIPALYREIQAIYDKFDDWDAALRDELEKDDGIDLRRMLYLGAEVFENPLGVSDYGLRTVLQTDFVEKPDGKIEIQVVNESRGLTTDFGELVKEVCRLERVITVPYLTAASPMEYRVYCNNFYSDAGGPFLGCIYLGERQRRFREGDFYLADHFFARFRTAYLRHLRLYAQPEKPGVEALKNC